MCTDSIIHDMAKDEFIISAAIWAPTLAHVETAGARFDIFGNVEHRAFS